MKYVLLIILFLMPIKGFSKIQPKNFNKRHGRILKSLIWAADNAEIPRELLMAVCWGESNFKTVGVTHLDGDTISHSICQMKLETAQFLDFYYRHKHKATPERLENPKINAMYAAKLLKYHLDRYNDNWKLAVDAYNKGTAISDDTEYVERVEHCLEFIRNHVKPEYIYAGNRLKEL